MPNNRTHVKFLKNNKDTDIFQSQLGGRMSREGRREERGRRNEACGEGLRKGRLQEMPEYRR